MEFQVDRIFMKQWEVTLFAHFYLQINMHLLSTFKDKIILNTVFYNELYSFFLSLFFIIILFIRAMCL